jgi:hypothetical protein
MMAAPFKNYQVVADPNAISEEILKKVTTGACIKVQGEDCSFTRIRPIRRIDCQYP